MESDNPPIDGSSRTPPPHVAESDDSPSDGSSRTPPAELAKEDVPAINLPSPDFPSNVALVQRLSNLTICNSTENSPEINSNLSATKPDAVKQEQLDSDALTNFSSSAVSGMNSGERKENKPNFLIHGSSRTRTSPPHVVREDFPARNLPPPISDTGLVRRALKLSMFNSIEILPPINSILSVMKPSVVEQEQSDSDARSIFSSPAVPGLNFGKRKDMEIEVNESNKKSKMLPTESSVGGGALKPRYVLLGARLAQTLAARRENPNPRMKLFQEKFNARMKQLQEPVPECNKILPKSVKVVSVRLKLFIDTRSNTVVYAEAGKCFVEWLFEILSLPMPLATFIGLSVTGQMNGSLENLHTSIQNLINSQHILTKDASFFQPLHPAAMNKFRSCPSGHNFVASSTYCPECRMNVISTMHYVASPSVKEGSYMVTDDLMVKPMFTADIANVFDRLSLNEEGALEERVVNLVTNKDEGAKLIHSAFSSKKVLTDVFILGLGSINSFGFSPSLSS